MENALPPPKEVKKESGEEGIFEEEVKNCTDKLLVHVTFTPI